MSERRADARRRTLMSGRLSAAPSGARAETLADTLNCVVLDLSKRGARLLCRTAGVEGDVVLQLKAGRDFMRRARIAWRRAEDCGVEFIEPELDTRSEPHHPASPRLAVDPSRSPGGFPQPSAAPPDARF